MFSTSDVAASAIPPIRLPTATSTLAPLFLSTYIPRNGNIGIVINLISGITDNSSAETTSFSYIGRADKVYVYGGYTRSISFTVQIVAQRKEDVKLIWEKVNYAKG